MENIRTQSGFKTKRKNVISFMKYLLPFYLMRVFIFFMINRPDCFAFELSRESSGKVEWII